MRKYRAILAMISGFVAFSLSSTVFAQFTTPLESDRRVACPQGTLLVDSRIVVGIGRAGGSESYYVEEAARDYAVANWRIKREALRRQCANQGGQLAYAEKFFSYSCEQGPRSFRYPSVWECAYQIDVACCQ